MFCYKRRYRASAVHGYFESDRVDAAPKLLKNTRAYIVDKQYAVVDTLKKKPFHNIGDIDEPISSCSMRLDSPTQSPDLRRKVYDTSSSSIKFGEEDPEWQRMEIQLKIDPTGKQDPIITRKIPNECRLDDSYDDG